MADSPAPAVGSSTAESPAQEKARLRREKRAAKITAGGASRLQAISSLQGGSTFRDVGKDVPAKPIPTPPTAASGAATPDPDEVDISEPHLNPATLPRLPSPFAQGGAPVSQMPGGIPASDPSKDPMMGILQQLVGDIPGSQGQGHGGPLGDLPPGLAQMLEGMQSGRPATPSPEQSSAWIWRLVHSLFSICLATYIVFQTPFTGSKLSRTSASNSGDGWTPDSSPEETFKHLFYLFATFEVVLQSSRYFIEKGQLQGGGFLSSIAQLLPEPYAGYIRVVGRYSVIYSTVVSDAMVVVFVLGAASWWRGGVTS